MAWSVILGGAAAMFVLLPVVGNGPLLQRPARILVSIAVGAVVAAGLFFANRRIKKVSNELNEVAWARLCPSCGYDMENTPAESDGCIVCTECGAAWRFPSWDELVGEVNNHGARHRRDRAGGDDQALPGP